MGSHIDREELERLADTMNRDVFIKIIQIGFGISKFDSLKLHLKLQIRTHKVK